MAQTSRYRAEQAVTVSKAVERGDLPAETIARVKSGEVPLKDAAAQARPAGKPEPTFEARFAKWWALFDRLFADEERGTAMALAVSNLKTGEGK